jgi:hypothetical protein
MASHHAHRDDGNLAEILKDSPKNWGRWGADDEVGALNFLDADQVRRGAAAIRQGRTFTLQVPIGHPQGDPIWPGRAQPIHVNILDKGDFACGRGPAIPGGSEYSDDMIVMFLQGTTQYDALGHAWIEDQLWNGYDARTTGKKMTKADIFPVAERGVVGRGVLIDMARHRGKDALERGEGFDHTDLLEAAAAQGVTIEKRDILLVRTGCGSGPTTDRRRRNSIATLWSLDLVTRPNWSRGFMKWKFPTWSRIRSPTSYRSIPRPAPFFHCISR